MNCTRLAERRQAILEDRYQPAVVRLNPVDYNPAHRDHDSNLNLLLAALHARERLRHPDVERQDAGDVDGDEERPPGKTRRPLSGPGTHRDRET